MTTETMQAQHTTGETCQCARCRVWRRVETSEAYYGAFDALSAEMQAGPPRTESAPGSAGWAGRSSHLERCCPHPVDSHVFRPSPDEYEDGEAWVLACRRMRLGCQECSCREELWPEADSREMTEMDIEWERQQRDWDRERAS